MLKRIFKRAIRSAVATAIAGGMVKLQGDLKWIALLPVVAALGKFLRERFPKIADLIPV